MAVMRSENDLLTERVIGACINVHRATGPGLLESAYEVCLCRELSLSGIRFEHQVPLPIDYRGARLDCAYRIDFVIEGELILEIKSVEKLLPVHSSQLITYLRLASIPRGLLINFNQTLLRDGIKRLFKEQLRSADSQT